jgi:AraC family transcriptional regulator of adaptative response / DNA-3-methyladenine glycosylase II
MTWSPDFLWSRVVACDRAYDGRFYTGVVTTGIYCLPSCSARLPHFRNVRFFRTEAEAKAAGLRACLRCRPDAFRPGRDPELELVDRLRRRIRAHGSDIATVSDLARAGGLGRASLAELLKRRTGLTPSGWLRRERLEVARARLAASEDSVLAVALMSGFGSSASFHRRFLEAFGVTPGAWRRRARSAAT